MNACLYVFPTCSVGLAATIIFTVALLSAPHHVQAQQPTTTTTTTTTTPPAPFYPPTANYYDNVLQLYKWNGGARWALELNPEHPLYNSGSRVVPVGNGWYQNEGPQLNNIRNELSASPDYPKIRPWISIGHLGPYNEDDWRGAGFMHNQPITSFLTHNPNGDWKNLEISSIYYIPPGSQHAGFGPGAVDYVLRGGVNEDQYPMTCQATNYHIAFSGFGNNDDGGARIERDIEHTAGYCRGCISAKDIEGYKYIPYVPIGHPFGWKVVIYNSVDNKKVRLDAYIDTSANPGNHWNYMYSVIDDGNDPRIDSVRGQTQCQGVRPELPMNWGGTMVSWRQNWEGAMFRGLTVQSIDPPKF